MSRLRFVLALAWREGRASYRRLILLTAAVSAGVAALVSIDSFTRSLLASVQGQARALLGADLVLGSGNPFSPAAEAELRRLLEEAPSAATARVTRFAGMAYFPRTSGARVVQVVAAEPGYPFYGTVHTDPPEAWAALGTGGGALVDPSLLTGLQARVGDTLALGEARLVVRGVVQDVPGDVALRTALGPRVFIAASDLPATRLVVFGSRAQHEAYVKLPIGGNPDRLAERHRWALSEERVSLRTVAEDQQGLNRALGRLGRYLGLVGLVALLLGGVGVASAVGVLVRRKLETVAILRCLGASGRRVLAVYLVQAAAMGLLGSALGALAGLAVQLLLPRLLRDFIPVDVRFSPSPAAVAIGLGLGLWISAVFALIPLLAVRKISPLVLLRRPYEDQASRRPDWAQVAAALALAGTVVTVSWLRAPNTQIGLGFALAIGVALGLFRLSALLLTRAIRRFFPSGWPYVWRQGVANLFRPANQTASVVLALGFGAFLLDTLALVQFNLLRDLRVDSTVERPNLLLIDVQPDQRGPVEALLRKAGSPATAAVPLIQMRIASAKGVTAASVLGRGRDQDRQRRPNRWTLRREYRSTYRDVPGSSERIVAGKAWPVGAWTDRPVGADPVPVSLEVEIAEDLGVTVGDEIVWDVQGLRLVTRVANLRAVDWARFEPNFFAVFPDGPLRRAPQTFVTLTRVADPGRRATLQRRLAEQFPNVTSLDLSQVQHALDDVLGRVSLVIRFMALFSLAAGTVVLAGAVAASRYQRLREAVLLKTLGATRGQLLRIFLLEYASLGLLAALVAAGLASAGAWALVRFVFDGRFAWPLPPLAGLSAGVVLLTIAVGLAGSREVLRRTPLEALRAE